MNGRKRCLKRHTHTHGERERERESKRELTTMEIVL